MMLSTSTHGHGPTIAMSRRIRGVIAACALGAASPGLYAQQLAYNQVNQLKQLSIEQLTNVMVTSVTRGPEPLSRSAAAAAVVTGSQILSSGAMSVPEAIRYIPGINVAQLTASEWAVSSRGFASPNSPDLLVLSDGRSIYTPLFSGVFWDVQDYLMPDIDRIEVVRGPGATLWGSNAVNGVINIITKSAADTQGGWATVGGGSAVNALAAAQYGGQTDGENDNQGGGPLYYRVFAKYQSDAPEDYPAGASSDGWDLGHVGFRTDWKADSADAFTVQGDAYDGRIGQVIPSISIIGRPGLPPPLVIGVGGGNVLAHWQHTMSDDSDYEVRVYYDYTHRDDPTFLDDLSTLDIDFLEHQHLGQDQTITWGLSGRTMDDITHGRGILSLNPPDARYNLGSGFVQDEIVLPDSVHLTLGTKLEHNGFSGFEVQPSVRAAWNLSDTSTLWSAVSRAVRVPTRIEQDEDIVASNPAGNPVIVLLGNRNFRAEEVLAFELGYRWQPLTDLSLDLAAFRNRYTGLESLELGTPFLDTAGQTIYPVLAENLIDGHATGLEGLVQYSPVDWWRVAVNYSYMQMSLQPLGEDLNRNRFYAGSTPRNQAGIQSYFDLSHNVELYGGVRVLSAVETLPEIVNGTGDPGYQELDVNAIWHVNPRLTLSLEGDSLLHTSHIEFGDPDERSAIKRSVFGRLTWNM
ncbi:MAG TPA: TonB-dependent receptor [Steroidobacteraceae bacterium]|nr:TonB-dependent receptor [Steroidobacteraceae bacterium]